MSFLFIASVSSCKKKKACTIKVIDWPAVDNDNQDFAAKHPDALKAGSKEDLVTQVKKKMKDSKCKCIKKLILLGHGESGIISTGAGQVATECKEINGHQKEWGPVLTPLKGKFCKGAELILFGCEVGKGEAGAAKLLELANFFGVTVKAPTTDVYAHQDPETHSDQEAKPNKKPKPKGDDKPGKRLKRKSRTSISLPGSGEVQAMAVYEGTREFWANQPDTIDYFITDENMIQNLINGIDLETEYDGEGLKTRYNAKVFVLNKDQSTMDFHLVLDWNGIELIEENGISIFLLFPETVDLYKSVAR